MTRSSRVHPARVVLGALTVCMMAASGLRAVFSVYIKPMEAEVGALSGWIFFAHQVGAAMGAATAGWIFEWTGSYASAFMSGAFLAILGAGLTLAIREERVIARRTPSSAPAPATT